MNIEDKNYDTYKQSHISSQGQYQRYCCHRHGHPVNFQSNLCTIVLQTKCYAKRTTTTDSILHENRGSIQEYRREKLKCKSIYIDI